MKPDLAMMQEKSIRLASNPCFHQDFGRITEKAPKGVFSALTIEDIRLALSFINEKDKIIHLRTGGVSQLGNILTDKNYILDLSNFKGITIEADGIWCSAGDSFLTLVEKAYQIGKKPYIVPYNLDLSIAGVLSVGGIGGSSFQFGSILDTVLALDVMLADGSVQTVNKNDRLFKAVLGTQGTIGIILKAKFALIPIQPELKTIYLAFDTIESMLATFHTYQSILTYVEMFASPCIYGAPLNNNARKPQALWRYMLQLTFGQDVFNNSKFKSLFSSPHLIASHLTDELEFLKRHTSRFEMMKLSGQWDMCHPWFECFLSETHLKSILPSVLPSLPLFYANAVIITPIIHLSSSYLQLSDDTDFSWAMMILSPGVPNALLPMCIQTIDNLNEVCLNAKGKRYLSGYLGNVTNKALFFERHFDYQYDNLLKDKQYFDPNGILYTFYCYNND
jgi:hypothetical protein